MLASKPMVRHFRLLGDDVIEIPGQENPGDVAAGRQPTAPSSEPHHMGDLTGGASCAYAAAGGVGSVAEEKDVPQELSDSGAVYTADEVLRSHLVGVKFDAPVLQEWLRKIQTPEEDRTLELFAECLEKRGPHPAHAPRPELPEEAAEMQRLAEQIATERARLEQREQSLVAQLADVELKRKERAEEFSCFALPPWFDGVEGTMNIGVVGNSGVGKSLLINRLRKLQSGDEGWAPVGVKATTTTISMYAYPGQPKMRLWDFPGAGSPAASLKAYIARMGLRHLDMVLIVTAGRFTETEVALRKELAAYKVPFRMVRTKADIDVWNNALDNEASADMTVMQISDNLKRHTGVKPYIVSLRHPDQYDFPDLLKDLLTSPEEDASAWEDSWVMPEVHSLAISAIQGCWKDRMGGVYFVHGLQVHVSTAGKNLHGATTLREDDEGNVWWVGRYSINEASISQAHKNGELRWFPADVKVNRPMIWWWSG